MVVSSCPIDDDVRDPCQHNVGSIDASSCCQLAKMVQPVKTRAIEGLIDLEDTFELAIVPDFPLLIIFVCTHNLIFFASDPLLEIVDVIGIMKQIELVFGGFFRLEHGEVVTQVVVLDEGVCHLDAFGLHGMLLAEVIIGNRIVVEVTHLTHAKYL